MSRQRKNKPVPVRAKCLTKTSLKNIKPMTYNQSKTFDAFDDFMRTRQKLSLFALCYQQEI